MVRSTNNHAQTAMALVINLALVAAVIAGVVASVTPLLA